MLLFPSLELPGEGPPWALAEQHAPQVRIGDAKFARGLNPAGSANHFAFGLARHIEHIGAHRQCSSKKNFIVGDACKFEAVPMPRLNALADREIEICKRLKSYRQALRLSRSAFASETRLDSHLISRIENLRMPLRFGVFLSIATRFPVNPHWLATGIGQQTFLTTLPSLASLGASVDQLFSSVYSEKLEQIVYEQIVDAIAAEREKDPLKSSRYIDSPSGRLAVIRSLEMNLRSSIAAVPDGEVLRFYQAVEAAVARLVSEYPYSIPEVMRRYEQVEMLEEDAILRGEMFRSGNERLRYRITPRHQHITKTTDKLDNSSHVARVGDVTSEVPTWPGLKGELLKLTAERGMKAWLADELGVSRQVVNNWLATSDQGRPDAENTLLLLRWVKGGGGKIKIPRK